MRLAFVYLPGRLQRFESPDLSSDLNRLYPDGSLRPTEFFYGAFELRNRGHQIGIFEAIERPRRSIFKYLAEYTLKAKYLPVKTYAGTIDATWFLLKDLERYNVVVATSSGVAFSLGIWKALGLLRRPIISIQCGILNYSFNDIRIFLTHKLLNRMSSQLFGVGELEEIVNIYKVDQSKIEVNCFGVDTGFWHPGIEQSTGEYILSVGNDAQRDFATLIETAKKIDKSFVIITQRQLPKTLPSNVTHIQGSWNSEQITDIALRKLYREAMCVVVPLKQSRQPSGQSVALQAMACGKPVIITKTRGIWEEDHLQHMHNTIFVPPEDPEALFQIIQMLEHDTILRRDIGAAAREYVQAHGDIIDFSKRLETRCLQLAAEN